MNTVFLVAGARPNFMKIAPLYKRLGAVPDIDTQIVHTGQHYDEAMSDVFFRQLGLPQPHISLTVGSAPHGAQTGRVLERFESALLEHQPAAVVVVGDVNSTLACALATAKVQFADGSRPLLVHVEAGLRSGDRSMPEEVNRVLTDAISDVLFTTEESAAANLLRENVAAARIHFVGNVMIDCLLNAWPHIENRRAWESLGLAPHTYGLVTLHRPSNVDDPDVLAGIVSDFTTIARRLPLIFPVHPRTRERLKGAGLGDSPGIRLIDPLGLSRVHQPRIRRPKLSSPTPAACRKNRLSFMCRVSRCVTTPSVRSRSRTGRTHWWAAGRSILSARRSKRSRVMISKARTTAMGWSGVGPNRADSPAGDNVSI